MARVKIFVVATAEAAERLIERFDRSGIQAQALDAALLEDERGRPLHQGRSAGVICQVAEDEHAGRIDEAFHASGIDALVLDKTFSGTIDQPTRRLVVVFRSLDALRANLMRNLLETQGVAAAVTGDSLAVGAMGLHNSAVAAAVLVGEQDLETARRIVQTAEAKSLAGAGADASTWDDEREEAEPDNALEIWPTCPGCGRRRTTVCPFCETVGNQFPAADANFSADNEDETGPALAIICTTCDEPWVPDFYRRCEWCGHDFGRGLATPQGEPEIRPPERINPRALLVALGLFASCALALIYFAFVARS